MWGCTAPRGVVRWGATALVGKVGELDESNGPRQVRLTRCPRTHGHRQARAWRRRGASARSCGFRQPRRLAHPARGAVHRPHAIRTTKTEGQGSGCDVAGRVEAVGNNVTMLQPGEEVFGSPFMHGLGAFAEWVCISEDLLAPKPAALSFEQVAAVPLAASTALQGLRDQGQLEPGHKVLIIGASGGVGTFAVQIAKSFDAEVSGVCSTRNVEMVRALGAEHVIDYTQDDFTQSGQKKYELILQLAGTRSPSECRRALTPKGTLVQISGESDGRWIGAVDRI